VSLKPWTSGVGEKPAALLADAGPPHETTFCLHNSPFVGHKPDHSGTSFITSRPVFHRSRGAMIGYVSNAEQGDRAADLRGP